jgi:glucose/arabinose dehydrogenase
VAGSTTQRRPRGRGRGLLLGLGAIGALGALAELGLRSETPTEARRPPASFDLAPVASGLEAPSGVVARPGDPGRLYVLEQAGRVRIVEDGRALSKPFLDLTDRVESGGERGLLGLAFHPDHARNGRLFVHYSDRGADTRVVEFTARGDRVDASAGRVFLRQAQPYENHKGGQLAFGPDGRLYLGLGDGGSAFDPQGRGQRLDTFLGKLLRRDVDRPGGRWEIAAFGLRNPWRFSFDRASGDLWLADVGQDAYEEIDRVPAGDRRLLNFGWGVYEGPARQPRRRRLQRRRGQLAWPVFSYGRREGCSVTGGYVYRGRRVPALRGRYLLGDLCSGRLWTLRGAPGAGPPVRRERPTLPLVTSFGEDAEGELYAVTYQGELRAVVPAGEDADR